MNYSCKNNIKNNIKNIIAKHYFKFIVIILLLILSFNIFKIFSKKEDDIYIKLDSLKNMTSYATNISITCKNDKQELIYTGKQKYIKDKGGILQLEKNDYLYKNGKLYIKNKGTGKVIEERNKKDDIFRLSFMEEYLKYIYMDQNLQNIKVKSEKKGEETLCFPIMGNNENLKNAKLVINNLDGLPRELIILNKKNEVTVKIKYEKFLKNAEVNEEELKF